MRAKRAAKVQNVAAVVLGAMLIAWVPSASAEVEATGGAQTWDGGHSIHSNLVASHTAGKVWGVDSVSPSPLTPRVIHVAIVGSATSPYDTWAKATSSIQDAVALAGADDVVLVGNGTFEATSTLIVSNAFTIRGVNGPEAATIARDTGAGLFRVISLTASGAALQGLTIADGLLADHGSGVRMLAGTTMSNCVVRNCKASAGSKLGNAIYATGAQISDCLITNCYYTGAYGTVALDGGSTIEDATIVASAQQQKGALYLKGSGNTARRCLILNNLGNVYGPGGGQVDAGSRMVNCLVAGNTSVSGNGYAGGIRLVGGALVNCTIVNNQVTAVPTAAGGVYQTSGVVSNCVIYGNTVYGLDNDYYGSASAVWSSCAPELTPGTQGNVGGDPLFEDVAGGDYRLTPASPCVDAGAALGDVAVDIDGTGRPLDGDGDTVAAYDMGAFEAADGSSLPLQVSFYGALPVAGVTSVAVTFYASTAGANQAIVWHGWDWDNDGTYDDIGGALAAQSHTFGIGHHDVVLLASNAIGESAIVTNSDAVHVAARDIYVATTGSDTVPYSSWATAATDLPSALDEALSGCTIHVSNGQYKVQSEIFLDGISLVGATGPEDVEIARDTAAGNFRVVRLYSSGDRLANVTIADGNSPGHGAGVYLDAGTTMSNCIVRDCALTGKHIWGNGAYATGGRIVDCVFTNCDYSQGQGIVVLDDGSTMEDSTIIDGYFQTYAALYLYGSGNVARRCRVLGNLANYYGSGGVRVDTGSRLVNCLVAGNSSSGNSGQAGGVMLTGGTLVNCTITDNTVAAGTSGGGGVYRTSSGVVSNCIVYGNTANGVADDYDGDAAAAWYSCAPELTAGVQGNITSDPLFDDPGNNDYHLPALSPCVDAGADLADVALDLDGLSRPLDGNGDSAFAADMGAYEAPTAVGLPLAVSLAGAPLAGVESLVVTLDPALVGSDTTIVWHAWDWNGDGTYDQVGGAIGGTVDHTFGVGHHTVALTVSNATEGASTTNVNMVHVAPTDIYVATNGSHSASFATWAAAATSVLAAVDEALEGCTIHVSNGQYKVRSEVFLDGVSLLGATGPEDVEIARDPSAGNFRVVRLYGSGDRLENVTIAAGSSSGSGAGVYLAAGTSMSNCIVRDCALTGKFIWGNGAYATGAQIVDCVFTNCDYSQGQGIVVLDDGSRMEDSTIIDCYFQTYAALYLRDSGNVARRCRVLGNLANYYGSGGAMVDTGSRLVNCLVAGNSSSGNSGQAGGVILTGGILVNCTISGNTVVAGTSGGGGVYRTSSGVVSNCIVYGNTANGVAEDYDGDAAAAWYSCAPELTAGAQGNITSDPLFDDPGNGDYHLPAPSPCVDVGADLADVTLDLDGASRPLDGNGDTVFVTDMGAYEAPTAAGLPLGVSLSGSSLAGVESLVVTLEPTLVGWDTTIVWHGWDWNGDGIYDQVGGAIGATVDHTFGVGHHTVALTVSNATEGASTTNLDMVHVAPTDIYVATNGSHSASFATWATAATNVLDAVDEALDGCTIHVSNGTYTAGSGVSLNRDVTLRGVNGPSVTTIDALGSARAIHITKAGVVVEGLTLTNGYSGVSGAGIYTTDDCLVSNCVITHCLCPGNADGAVYMTAGRIVGSTIRACSGADGTVYLNGAVIEDCLIEDNYGLTHGALNLIGAQARRCRILNNTGSLYGPGGGAISGASLMENCLVAGNTSTRDDVCAGGIVLTAGEMINCTIADNFVAAATSGGGGIYRTGGTLQNCVVSGNTANGVDDDYDGAASAASYSCAPELTSGTGNITGDPLFLNAAAGDYRLLWASPCIDKGVNLVGMPAAVDLDGGSRIFNGTVDMGAYETVPPVSTVFRMR